MVQSPLAPLDPASVRPYVLQCLRRLLPGDVLSMDDVLDPIDDLGLDSLDGVNFVVLLGKDLHFDFPEEFNPFFDKAGCTRSIGRIVESVCRSMQSTPAGATTPAAQP